MLYDSFNRKNYFGGPPFFHPILRATVRRFLGLLNSGISTYWLKHTKTEGPLKNQVFHYT